MARAISLQKPPADTETKSVESLIATDLLLLLALVSARRLSFFLSCRVMTRSRRKIDGDHDDDYEDDDAQT